MESSGDNTRNKAKAAASLVPSAVGAAKKAFLTAQAEGGTGNDFRSIRSSFNNRFCHLLLSQRHGGILKICWINARSSSLVTPYAVRGFLCL
jgi:hypothetical protein